MTRPIQSTMETTLQKIKEMVDVDTVIGNPINMDTNRVLVPFSKVSFGFLSGGGELTNEAMHSDNTTVSSDELNFIGGGASGVSIKPMGFIVSDEHGIKLLPIGYSSSVDRAIDSLPRLIEEIKRVVKRSNDENA